MTEHTMAARFEGATWHTMLTASPVLDGALVAFDCRIERIVEVGTHDIFICPVEAVEVGTMNEGLIYYARGYHRVIYRG
jgi:flavin reductase